MKEKVFSDWYHQTRDITARAGFDAAWQHQQVKVEELQTLYTQQGINMLKMQKRVDVLTQTMEEVLEEMKYPTATFEEVIVCGVKVLEQALKGGGDE